MTLDHPLTKEIWVPDFFFLFVHSKTSSFHDTTVENILLCMDSDRNVLFSLRDIFSSYYKLISQLKLMLILFVGFIFGLTEELFLQEFPWVIPSTSLRKVNMEKRSRITPSMVVSGISASMPQVSYTMAVDVYLGDSSLFVFLSVCGMYNIVAVQVMAFNGCYSYGEIDKGQTSFSLHSAEDSTQWQSNLSWIKRRSLGRHVGRIILNNNYIIDTYSRLLFPIVYIVFHLFY
ncbi:Gamma-aminobutyric acid receptor subunit rho-3, partial [Galemys pyrenaicus]